ncbi:MAG: PAS domain-containing protein, partial [Gammaproteobacteria bacterium]|nr:PAS domain-containing protein [Gammaproteobacteria bacterium]MCB1882294.1 PAS domain-containing protein [Gammaproteobacteria bacterium]
MKINLPVTNIEKEIRADHNILSTTDLKGAISYVNPDFIEISGFTEEELLGKNHNIVRHPDMPPMAFSSLWSNVKAGQAWMGMVKNRCKDGDHYWVDAFVMPIQKDGVVVEYQSVRSKPEKIWVERAESIYKHLREGKAFKVGLAARLGLTGKLIVGNLLALAPTVIFSMLPSLSSLLPVGFLLSAAAGMAVNIGLLRPLRQVIA